MKGLRFTLGMPRPPSSPVRNSGRGEHGGGSAHSGMTRLLGGRPVVPPAGA